MLELEKLLAVDCDEAEDLEDEDRLDELLADDRLLMLDVDELERLDRLLAEDAEDKLLAVDVLLDDAELVELEDFDDEELLLVPL